MQSVKEQWRIFCAVKIPPDVCATVIEHIESLRRTAISIAHKARWERVDKLHLTLKFFGNVESRRVPDLTNAITRAALSVSPFELKIEGAGAFPPLGSPRVLWLGVTDASGELARLQNRIEDECANENFAREARAFQSHLTIARTDRMRAPDIRELARLHTETVFNAISFLVSEIVIMRSDLGAGGSHYTSLERINIT